MITRPAILKNYKWTPRHLVGSGDMALWFDFTDLSTLYTDTAATARVNGVGDAIAAIVDKGPYGAVLTQPTGTSCPLVDLVAGSPSFCATFDGSDDHLIASSGPACQITNNVAAIAAFAKVRVGVLIQSSVISFNTATPNARFLLRASVPALFNGCGVQIRRQDADAAAQAIGSGTDLTVNEISSVGANIDYGSAIAYIYQNNIVTESAIGTIGAGKTTATDSPSIAIGANGAGTADRITGQIWEIIVMRGANLTHWNLIRNYFEGK